MGNDTLNLEKNLQHFVSLKYRDHLGECLTDLFIASDPAFDVIASLCAERKAFSNQEALESEFWSRLVSSGFIKATMCKRYPEESLRLHTKRMAEVLFSYFRRHLSNGNGTGNGD